MVIMETPLWWHLVKGNQSRQYNKFKWTRDEAVHLFNYLETRNVN